MYRLILLKKCVLFLNDVLGLLAVNNYYNIIANIFIMNNTNVPY